MSRSFVIVSAKTSKNTSLRTSPGRYISDTPSSAAKKMFSTINQSKKHKTLTITCRETTAGSLKKEYAYKITKVANKQEVIIDGVPVVFKFTTKTKAV